jgi:putative FmdB family regulatory protein
MPIYDYRCDHCGHAFSAVQSFSDAQVEVCPNCGKKPRKLLVAPAVVFKGSGWYKTDSRTAPKDEGGSTAKKDEGGSAAKKDEGGTAKKDEPKKETKTDAAAPSSSAPAKGEASS